MRDPNKDPAASYRPAEPDWFAAARKPLQEVNGRLIDLLAVAAEDPDELGGRSRFLESGGTTVLCQFCVGHATHERRSHLRPCTNGRQLFIRCPA